MIEDTPKPGTGWKELPPGGTIVKAGNAREYYTGGWRTERPKLDPEKCTNCLTCWIYCPDSAIIVKEGKVYFDYDICKGCGICANVCPPKIQAIAMVDISEPISEEERIVNLERVALGGLK
ncbi:MAG: 4Fe-4S dicluster domain-containing protein [bacterium]